MWNHFLNAAIYLQELLLCSLNITVVSFSSFFYALLASLF